MRLLYAFLLLAIVAGCTQSLAGSIQGKVDIGPFCPVERPGVPCPVPPEAYSSRQVVIYTPDHRSVVKEINIRSDGSYYAELPPGKYVVDIKSRSAIERSGQVPAQITIVSGKTEYLNISIDTGIR